MLIHQGYFRILRTVPVFVCTHTLCPSLKAWFTRNAHADNDIDVINYATTFATKMKAKFSYPDQIKFNEPEIKPVTLE